MDFFVDLDRNWTNRQFLFVKSLWRYLFPVTCNEVPLILTKLTKIIASKARFMLIAYRYISVYCYSGDELGKFCFNFVPPMYMSDQDQVNPDPIGTACPIHTRHSWGAK